MDPDRSTNIELYKVFQTFSLSIAFLFVSRAIVSLKYIWSSKRYARIMSLTALRSEFNLENLQGDLGVCTLSTVASMLIASKAATMAHSVNLTIVIFSWLFRQRRNNRAIGLAWGYYFGYLKKVTFSSTLFPDKSILKTQKANFFTVAVIQHFPATAGNMPTHFLTTKLYLEPPGTNLLFLQIL